MTTTMQDPAAVTYHDLQHSIEAIARTLATKHQQDFDETLSNINMIFVNAWQHYRDGCGSFLGYLNWLIPKRMIMQRRAEQRKKAGRLKFQPPEFFADRAEEPRFCPHQFAEGLSPDGQTFMEYLGKAPGQTRAPAVRAHLKSLGFDHARICRAFNEVKSAWQDRS